MSDPAPAFHKFTLLPPKLQTMIWDLAGTNAAASLRAPIILNRHMQEEPTYTEFTSNVDVWGDGGGIYGFHRLPILRAWKTAMQDFQPYSPGVVESKRAVIEGLEKDIAAELAWTERVRECGGVRQAVPKDLDVEFLKTFMVRYNPAYDEDLSYWEVFLLVLGEKGYGANALKGVHRLELLMEWRKVIEKIEVKVAEGEGEGAKDIEGIETAMENLMGNLEEGEEEGADEIEEMETAKEDLLANLKEEFRKAWRFEYKRRVVKVPGGTWTYHQYGVYFVPDMVESSDEEM